MLDLVLKVSLHLSDHISVEKKKVSVSLTGYKSLLGYFMVAKLVQDFSTLGLVNIKKWKMLPHH